MTLLNAAGLTGFLTGGTLLGFVRNGAPLPHDRDADIGILCDRYARPDITAILRAHPSIQLARSARAGDRYVGLTLGTVAVDLFLYEAEGPYRLCGFSDHPGEIQWRFSGFGVSRKIWQGASWNIPDNPDKPACRRCRTHAHRRSNRGRQIRPSLIPVFAVQPLHGSAGLCV